MLVIVIHLSEEAEADETKFCSDFEDLIIPAAQPPICGACGNLRFLPCGAWFKAAASPLDEKGSLWKVEEATAAGIVVVEVTVVASAESSSYSFEFEFHQV